MNTNKKAFGTFLATKRQASGLTQRELATQLYVTESAVSKWERGLSYPDVSMVQALANELGVQVGELVTASDDYVTAELEREARFYRRWRSGLLWTLGLSIATALLVCFIVAVSTGHLTDWFMVVAAGLLTTASITVLPLLPASFAPKLHRGLLVLFSVLVSVTLLLGVVALVYGGGSWLPISIVAVLLGLSMVFTPLVLRALKLPLPWRNHVTVISLALDTVLLFALLLVIFQSMGDLNTFAAKAAPIAGIGVLFAWVPALIVRYLPARGLVKASVLLAFAAIGTYFINPAIGAFSGEKQDRPVDLTQWHGDYIDGNLSLVTMLGCLIAAVLLGLTGALSSRENRN